MTKQEFEDDLRESAHIDNIRRVNLDYLLDEHIAEIAEAKEILLRVLDRVNEYGWNMKNEKELLKYV